MGSSLKRIFGRAKALGLSGAVAAYASQAAFFWIISAFPFAMLLLTGLRHLPGLARMLQVQSRLFALAPPPLGAFLQRIAAELTQSGGVALGSVAALGALLAASKGFLALVRGLNAVYDKPERRSFFALRALAVVGTLCLMLSVALSLALVAFGQSLVRLLTGRLPWLLQAAPLLALLRPAAAWLVLTLVFTLLYLFAPNRSSRFLAELPGAALCAAGWIGFSMLYSWYIAHVNTVLYGSLTAAVFIMLWLYACLYMLLLGGRINCLLSARPPKAKRKQSV